MHSSTIKILKMLVILNFVSRCVFEGLTMVTGKAGAVLCMPLGRRGEKIYVSLFSTSVLMEVIYLF
jgi:hypothetical protein